jgi:hypothetical protein
MTSKRQANLYFKLEISANGDQMPPPRLVLPKSSNCIYCGSTDDLTIEHVIPFALGGRIELPDGSCRDCAKATSKIEQMVARNHLSIPRAIGGIQTRRLGQRPNETTIELLFNDGRTLKKRFSLDVAPIVNMVPCFKPTDTNWREGDLLSTCTLQSMGHWQNPARYQNIFDQTGASKATATSGSYKVGTWELVLWKMACGFFHVVCSNSLSNSGRALAVVGLGGPPITRQTPTPEGSSKGLTLLYEDLFSQFVVEKVRNFGAARVYTTKEDRYRNIYCELNVLSTLTFPRYTCRIPNLEGFEEFEREFSVLEEDGYLGKDADQLFVP